MSQLASLFRRSSRSAKRINNTIIVVEVEVVVVGERLIDLIQNASVCRKATVHAATVAGVL